MDLPTGREIVLHNMVVFVSEPHDKTLGLQYRTDVRGDQRAERIADATALVQIYKDFSASQGISRVTAQVCNSDAAAAMREPAEEIFSFSLAGDSRWLLEKR